jgi:2-polyprenyl-3-methyl-5-hydroxy-6-metoxy-1,4-benzoquinol methylase
VETNKHSWNVLATASAASRFYDLASFRKGRSSLNSIILDEVGDVRGKSILDMQCHLGLDALSWARLGARVVGADLSDVAINTAAGLAAELDLDAEFVCCNVYGLPDVVEGKFDVVFTGYGCLSCLPDLGRWARVVDHFLKPGGKFCMVEIHPMATIFADVDGEFRLAYSLLDKGAFRQEVVRTWADSATVPAHTQYAWRWTVGALMSSLISTGLRIDRLRELPLDMRRRYPSMVQGEDGYWRVPGDPIPLAVTCTATKPE